MSTVSDKLVWSLAGLTSMDGVYGGVGLESEFSFRIFRWIGNVNVNGSFSFLDLCRLKIVSVVLQVETTKEELGVDAALLCSCSAGDTGSEEQLDCLVRLFPLTFALFRLPDNFFTRVGLVPSTLLTLCSSVFLTRFVLLISFPLCLVAAASCFFSIFSNCFKYA